MYSNDPLFRRVKRTSNFTGKKWDSKILDKEDGLPFNTIVMFIGIICTAPFTWKKPHNPSLHPTKSTIAVATAWITIILLSACSMLIFYFYRLATEKLQLDEKLLHFQSIGVSSSAFLTLAVWSDARAARRGFKIWFRIDYLYSKITNRKLIRHWRTFDPLIVVITVLYSTATFFATQYGFPILHMPNFFALCCIHTMTLFCLTCTLWIGYFVYLLGIAQDLNKELNLDIKRDSLTTYKLQCYEEMWLLIRTLADILGTFNSPLMIFVCSLATIINCFYLFLIYVRIEKYFQSLAPLMITTLLFGLLILMIIASHSAMDQIKLIHSVILAKNNFTSMQATLQYQVMFMYFVQRMRSPSPMFGNCIFVNKSLLLSLLGTIAMNLVVMVQLTQPKKNQNKLNNH